jgi:hypothetical protein
MGFIIYSRSYAHKLEAQALDSTFDDEDAAASRWLWSLQAQLPTQLLVNELSRPGADNYRIRALAGHDYANEHDRYLSRAFERVLYVCKLSAPDATLKLFLIRDKGLRSAA